MPEELDAQDHYGVLGLTSTDGNIDEKALKLAYRRALLIHHPDKSNQTSKYKPSIDQITIAYKTLSHPVARSEYDRLRASKHAAKGDGGQSTHSGLETMDLDDLCCDEAHGMWYQGCRCGKDQAYIVTVEDLEANAEYGETIIGCQGCSLWLRVTFAVAEADE